MTKIKVLYLVILCTVALSSCSKDPLLSNSEFGFLAPQGFPEMEMPEDNELTEDRWLLGKKLFYDPLLSRDSSISCGSCHLAANAFSDNVKFSTGVDGLQGTRNSPSLANIGYHPYFMREGGVPTLEQQVLVPIQEHVEMDFNLVAAAGRVAQIEAYNNISQKAYGRDIDYYVITRAIACFERTLISGNSRYDKFTYQGLTSSLTEMEVRGKELFFSNKTKCSTCHSDFNFTNYGFANNGLYETYQDEGRYILTGDPMDFSKFKVPSLRNVALTAPYMHDGSINTLTEVVEHYNGGGANNPNKDSSIQALNLSESEKQELVAFLKALTDYEFISDTRFQP